MPQRLSPQQREEIVLMLESMPTASNMEIGGRVSGGGVSPTTVSRVRQSLREAYREAQEEEQRYQRHSVSTNGFHANVSPFPAASLSEGLPRVAGVGEPPPPPRSGAVLGDALAETPEKVVESLPSLTAGTLDFLDKLGTPLANIAVLLAGWAAPDVLKPAVPSPELTKILLICPARIFARHAHLQIDKMSEDGQDIMAIATAMAAWALEMRQNYTLYAQWRREQSGNVGATGNIPRQGNFPGNATAASGPVTSSPEASGFVGASGAAVSPSGASSNPLAGLLGGLAANTAAGVRQQPVQSGGLFATPANTSTTPFVAPNGAAYPDRSAQSNASDVAYGRMAMGALYGADAIGRFRQGLQ